jgi:hypothetical protein
VLPRDEKYGSLTEEPHAAVFLPILQWPNGNGVQARHFPPEGHKMPFGDKPRHLSFGATSCIGVESD